MPVDKDAVLNGTRDEALQRPDRAPTINRLQLLKKLSERGVEVSYNDLESVVKLYGYPLDSLNSKQVDKLIAHFCPAKPQSPEEKQPEQGTIAPVEATQAEESAAKTLDLAMQSKVEGLQQAAERGANQATEEVLTEFTAYANVLLQGTEAATAAKSALREGLNQSAAPGVVAKDFSNFFRLKTAVKPAIGDENS